MDGGGRRWGESVKIFTLPPLSLFLTVDRPLGTLIYFSPHFRCYWNQSTRSPKLRLLCRLAYVRHHPNLQENYDIFQSDLWQKLPNVKRVLWNFLEPSHLASFFFLFFPWGRNFWRFCSLRHWTLHWKEAELILQKAAGHKFLGVSNASFDAR